MKMLLVLFLAVPSFAQNAVNAPTAPIPSFAQNAVNAPTAPIPTSLGTVSGTAVEVIQAVALANQAVAALPSGKWAGKLDLTKDFSFGGWQSLKSADQAYGLAKPLWTLEKGDQPLVKIGVFAGEDIPLVPLAKQGTRFLAGPTIAVPGSTLDWALGTSMGAAWVPNLKTGILYAQDFTRPKAMTWGSGFVGVGLTYPMF